MSETGLMVSISYKICKLIRTKKNKVFDAQRYEIFKNTKINHLYTTTVKKTLIICNVSVNLHFTTIISINYPQPRTT